MPERLHGPKPSGERLMQRHELEQAAVERRRSIEKKADTLSHGEVERQHENQVEKARDALKKVEIQPAAGHEATAERQAARPHHPLSGIGRRMNYERTMASVRQHLPTTSRAFSRVIHNPTIERASEVAGKTVARPSVTVGATTTAVLAGGFLYLFARHYGYQISYIYMPLFLALGGVIGIIFEGLTKLLFRRHR